jgi:hypothetical protein
MFYFGFFFFEQRVILKKILPKFFKVADSIHDGKEENILVLGKISFHG